MNTVDKSTAILFTAPTVEQEVAEKRAALLALIVLVAARRHAFDDDERDSLIDLFVTLGAEGDERGLDEIDPETDGRNNPTPSGVDAETP